MFFQKNKKHSNISVGKDICMEICVYKIIGRDGVMKFREHCCQRVVRFMSDFQSHSEVMEIEGTAEKNTSIETSDA